MRIVITTALIVLGMWYASNRGERRTKLYPGTCPDGNAWYLVDSDSDSVTVGCYDPDYNPE